MGFFSFTRSKKGKKESSPSRDQRWGPPHYKPRPPPPPSGSWYPNDPYLLPPPQPVGLLPAPPGWVPQSPPSHYQQPGAYPAPIVVNQHHYYLGPPPPPTPDQPACSGPTSKLNLGSVLDLAKEMCNPKVIDNNVNALQDCGTQLLNQSAALYDQISDRFNDVMTLIDGDRYVGNERDLFAWQSGQSPSQSPTLTGDRGGPKSKPKSRPRDHPKGQTSAAAAVISGNFFAKVELYGNSKLPMDLPPLRL